MTLFSKLFFDEAMEADIKKTDKATESIIFNFLRDNPNPDDHAIHAIAEKHGMEPDDFEEEVYKLLGSILGYGRAKEKDFTEEDADPKELKMGIKVEMEHTHNPVIAKRISLDHLAEISDYYTRLIKMEKEAGVED